MNEKQTGLEWFNINVKSLLVDDFELKYVDEKDGDLGDLSGVQFDLDKKGGYVYFWSSGYVGFQLVDYEKELEVVEDTTEEITSRSYDEVFNTLLLQLK
ncbi:hypothetical protein [Alteromonas lipotrueae]|uniref:hypothetical protein n=1 Tax=Alteromonas lipotrueae TaxID=2803814 RepID=UPI001C46D4C5|nr:hypothetical protein [Alteromonas lipotrueae]